MYLGLDVDVALENKHAIKPLIRTNHLGVMFL